MFRNTAPGMRNVPQGFSEIGPLGTGFGKQTMGNVGNQNPRQDRNPQIHIPMGAPFGSLFGNQNKKSPQINIQPFFNDDYNNNEDFMNIRNGLIQFNESFYNKLNQSNLGNSTYEQLNLYQKEITNNLNILNTLGNKLLKDLRNHYEREITRHASMYNTMHATPGFGITPGLNEYENAVRQAVEQDSDKNVEIDDVIEITREFGNKLQEKLNLIEKEITRKQAAEEQTRRQQEEQTRRQQEEAKKQEQTRRQQEEQTRRQQEEAKKQEQTKRQQEEQTKRQQEQTRRQQEQSRQQTPPPTEPATQKEAPSNCNSFFKTPKSCNSKKEYLLQMRDFHPDKNTGCPDDAKKKFEIVSKLCSKYVVTGTGELEKSGGLKKKQSTRRNKTNKSKRLNKKNKSKRLNKKNKSKRNKGKI